MLRGGWGDGDTAAVALPPFPEAAGGLEPRFCLLFLLHFPWRRDLCKRHRFSRRHQGHCGCWGGHVLPPALSCLPATRARSWLSPSSSQQDLGTHHVPLWGIVPVTASFLTATMTGFVTTATAPTKILRGVMASLSPSWSLCSCYCSHTVPTKATLSSPQPPQPQCPRAVPLCPLSSPQTLRPHRNHSILISATTATLSPHSPVSACHHGHCVLTTATSSSPQPLQASCVALSPQSPCVTLW